MLGQALPRYVPFVRMATSNCILSTTVAASIRAPSHLRKQVYSRRGSKLVRLPVSLAFPRCPAHRRITAQALCYVCPSPKRSDDCILALFQSLWSLKPGDHYFRAKKTRRDSSPYPLLWSQPRIGFIRMG